MRTRIRRQCYYDARVNDVNLEEITSSENNANILRALRDEQPDNFSKKIRLYTGELDAIINETDEIFFIREGDDMGWVGYFIGRSQILDSLVIADLPQDRERFDALMEGIARNKSITKLLIGTELGDADYQ